MDLGIREHVDALGVRSLLYPFANQQARNRRLIVLRNQPLLIVPRVQEANVYARRNNCLVLLRRDFRRNRQHSAVRKRKSNPA